MSLRTVRTACTAKQDPASKELKMYAYIKSFTQMFIASLFINSSKMERMDKQNVMLSIHLYNTTLLSNKKE